MKQHLPLQILPTLCLGMVVEPALGHAPETVLTGSLHATLHASYGNGHTVVLALLLGGTALALTSFLLKHLLKWWTARQAKPRD